MTKQELNAIFRKGKYGYVEYPEQGLVSPGSKIVDCHTLSAGDYVCLFSNKRYVGFHFGEIAFISSNTNKVNLFVRKLYRVRGWSKQKSFVDILRTFNNEQDDFVLFLLSKNDAQSQADRRRQYAKQRKLLSFARTEQSDAFTILGLTVNSSMEDLHLVKRKMMFAWHPDMHMNSGLSLKDFNKKSKEITDALSYVDSYLRRVNNK